MAYDDAIKCLGCERNWSYPYPDVCPRCDYLMVVPEPVLVGNVVEAESYTVSEDDPKPNLPLPEVYYCDRCGHQHKIDSAIGIAHGG